MDYNSYKDKLEKAISDYMDQPINPRTVEYIDSMVCLLQKLDCPEIDYDSWMDNLENEDGTTGAHWTLSQTNPYNDGFNEDDFNATMNMMYSDYCRVAERYGISIPDFYADMAKAFLNDKDSVEDKIRCYYNHVVEHK